MSEHILDAIHTSGIDEATFIKREKRGHLRKPIRSFITALLTPVRIEGIGSNLSETGAYFVTCDDIPVEIMIQEGNKERKIYGKIVRIDSISEGSHGVAIEFDTRQLKG